MSGPQTPTVKDRLSDRARALQRAGVPMAALQRLAEEIPTTVTGTPEERAEHVAEIMEELASARQRATSEVLRDEQAE
jgi:hypothetical protein